MSRTALLAVPILLFGVFLRFHDLQRQSLWDDEISSIRTISQPRQAVLNRFATYETHPPLYFLQLKIWRALGMRSLVKLRANSAVWGSLGLVLMFLAARYYKGDAPALAALALFSLSPYHLAYSQELRPYAMAVSIAIAGLMALERRSWRLLAFLWTAQLYTHYWGAFVVLAQGLYGWTSFESEDEKRKVLYTMGAAGVFFTPWLPIFISQLQVSNALTFWVAGFSLANLAKVFLAFTGMVFNMASWTFYLPTAVWVLALFGIAFAGALAAGLARGPKAAVWWLGVGLVVPWLLSLWKPAVFVWYRYPIHMFPAFVLLVAIGLFTLRPAWLGILLGALILSSQAWGTWTYFHRWQKANPEAVVRYIHFLKKENTIVVRPVYFSDLYSFYDQGTTPAMDEHTLDSREKRMALKGKNVIFVAFDVPADPIGDAFLEDYKVLSARYFPGLAHLGITVYELQ